MPRALRPNWLCESRVQPWRGTEPVAPEQAQAVLAGTQLPLLLLLRLLLSVSRGANFSNPNCCHKSLPLLLLLFAVCCLALFVSGRRSGLLLLLQMLLSSIAKESVWAKERKSVQARLATGPARWRGTDLAHSSFQVCRCRPVVYVMPVISELACGAQSAQCISLKRFYEPQGCRMEAPPPHLHLALLWPVPAPILMDPFGPIRHGN